MGQFSAEKPVAPGLALSGNQQYTGSWADDVLLRRERQAEMARLSGEPPFLWADHSIVATRRLREEKAVRAGRLGAVEGLRTRVHADIRKDRSPREDALPLGRFWRRGEIEADKDEDGDDSERCDRGKALHANLQRWRLES
jgi:hypothetical protein